MDETVDTDSASEIAFAFEPFERAFPEAQALFAEHFDEIAEHKDVFGAPDPDLDFYRALERGGALRVITARDRGRLVGYFVFALARRKHYRTVMGAVEDLYFLAPEYRKGLTGFRFLRYCAQAMAETSAQVISMRTKINHNHGAMLERLGFRPIEIIYEKVTHG